MTLEEYVAQLESRIAALEQAAVSSEAAQANYLTVDPVTHLIGAVFSGHIKATGLDLTLGSKNLAPGSINLVDWLDAGGAVEAYVEAYSSGNASINGNLELATQSADTLRSASLLLKTARNVGGNTSAVEAHTESVAVTVIDNNSGSNFLQLLSAQKAHCAFGLLSSTGAALFDSGDFTYTHPATGVYTCTWKVARPNANYIVLATPIAASGNLGGEIDNVTLSANSFEIVTFITGGADVNTKVGFLAITP